MTQATPLCGVFALDWAQVSIDNVEGLAPDWLRIGSAWRWGGRATRLDGNPGVLPLGRSLMQPDVRPRARAIAARLAGTDIRSDKLDPEHTAPANGFVLTDGERQYVGRLTQVWGNWLVVFSDILPPHETDLYVIACDPGLTSQPRVQVSQDVLCFSAETLIDTPTGPRPVDAIRAGDLVLTYDNGPQIVRWVGESRLSGLALRRFPHLRPVRVSAAALGTGVPTEDLLVSPAHRLLVQGARAQALFNQPEVLVCARDLIDGRAVRQDLALHGVGYVHLLLDRHEVLFANGVPCESFHPDLAAPDLLNPHDRALQDALRTGSFGTLARRCLSGPEAAFLLH
ncbi:MAG: Hint domain-containing protein [Roseinatronobacter sp.]